jgi:zona occludens toxin (predicted ATPase)
MAHLKQKKETGLRTRSPFQMFLLTASESLVTTTTVATASAATTVAATAAATVATTTAAAVATSAAATTAATAAATAWGARTCFVDRYITTSDRTAIKIFNRFLGILTIRHFDKSETTGSAGLPIHDDVNRRYLSKLFESRT